jgi:transcriptional regulator with XRE-family HTH domain
MPVMSARGGRSIPSFYRRRSGPSAKPLGIVPEAFGRQVAKLRAGLGWTQARLGDRIGVSRVALSHIEAGLSVPSERTVTLLAGVFGVEPHELVAGTNYPAAKAERLPLVAARHTEVDHQLALLDALTHLAGRLPEPCRSRALDDLRGEWRPRLTGLAQQAADPDERRRLLAAARRLAGLVDGRSSPPGERR